MTTHWRQALLVDLCDGKRSAQEIGSIVGLSRDAVISRMKRLAKQGLVTTTGAGNFKRYIALAERDPVDVEELRETVDEPKPKPRQPRNCLRCGKAFMSWGAGNRLCDFHARVGGDQDYHAHMPSLRY